MSRRSLSRVTVALGQTRLTVSAAPALDIMSSHVSELELEARVALPGPPSSESPGPASRSELWAWHVTVAGRRCDGGQPEPQTAAARIPSTSQVQVIDVARIQS